jgi:hypothetical protein
MFQSSDMRLYTLLSVNFSSRCIKVPDISYVQDVFFSDTAFPFAGIKTHLFSNTPISQLQG